MRLTLLATTVVAAFLIVASVALVISQRESLLSGVDLGLVQRADNITPRLRVDPGAAPLVELGDEEDGFEQVLAADGSVLRSTANVDGLDAVVAPRPPGPGDEFVTNREVELSKSPFRVLARSVRTADGPVTLVVAKNLDDVDESIGELRANLSVWVPVIVVGVGLLVWWLTGRVLRPVEAIRAEVAELGASDLHRRVPVPGHDDEIARLARTMNGMLDRIEAASERQEQFVADASHELRSPLTRLRTQLELAVAHPDGQTPATLRSLLADVIALDRLLDDLLVSARLESERHPNRSPVDLDDLVLDEARRVRDSTELHVDTGEVGAGRVAGDRGQLQRVVRNLADNAARHARSRVRFSVRERGEVTEFTVTDDGPGVSSVDHDRIFERFTRLDEARSRDAGGSGLGLAIVRDIVERHGGTITLDASSGLGARFVIELPRVD